MCTVVYCDHNRENITIEYFGNHIYETDPKKIKITLIFKGVKI